MKHINIFKDISQSYGEEIALTAMQILVISRRVKLKKKHLSGKKSFVADIVKLTRDILWETDQATFDKAFQIFMVLDSYCASIALEGLGGCTRKTFAELLRDEDEI